MLPENQEFVIRGEDGEEYGPVDMEELRAWVAENRAGIGTEVRLDEPGAIWQPWQTYPELVVLLAEVHVASPVPGMPGLTIAPMWRRVLAFGFDLVLVSLLVTPIFIVLALIFIPDFVIQYTVAAGQPLVTPPELPMYQKVIANLISDLMLAFYVSGFHAAHGCTPAKALFRVKVVDQTGAKPALVKSLLRAVALIFSMNLFFIPVAYAFFNPQRRAFHDLIAGTYVVEA